MTYLSKYLKLDNWRKSFIWSLVSSLFIAFTYIDPPPDTGYAGAQFSYNISFFLPMLGFSLISALIAFRSLLRFMNGLKDHEISHKRLRIMGTSLLLLPALLHLLPFIFLFIRNAML